MSMYVFLFHKPKQTIKNILLVLALISLFVNLMTMTTIVLWKYYPNYVSIIDKELHDPYRYKIRKLHKNVRKAKTQTDKYHSYEKLYIALKDITTLNKFYYYRQESANFLIDHYLKNNQYQEAKTIAERWKNKYPLDFKGKFKYSEVLESNNINDAVNYYATLYKRYYDVPEVINNYLSILTKVGALDLVEKIKLKTKDIISQNIEFKLYYMDRKNTYLESHAAIVDKTKYINDNNFITFEFERMFQEFNGLRLDIKNIPFSLQVWNFSIIAYIEDIEKELSIKKVYKLKKEDGKYHMIGNNPHFVLMIPNELLAKNGKIKFKISMNIGTEE